MARQEEMARLKRDRPSARVCRRTRPSALVAVLSLILILGACSSTTDDGTFQLVSPGGKSEFSYPAGDRLPLPEIAGPSVLEPNKTISVADFPGKVVVLNFWASWCSPCRGEAKALEVASALMKDRGAQFIGINVAERNSDSGADFMRSFGVTYPSISDPGQRVMLAIRNYPATALPSTIVLDRSHRVAHIWLGALDSPGPLVEVIRSLQSESVSPGGGP
ncbi:TlpA disulfide reductase family protein [Nakamurella aerolata]|nr:TlpA disulfide reductase family protein [Nakamurella aerolata]